MNTYVYTDKGINKVIFEVEAESILDADKSFEETFGFKPSTHSSIACQIFTGEFE